MAIDQTGTEDTTGAVEAARNYNPYTAEFLDHEFETYDTMRSGCPVGYSEAIDTMGMKGMWVTTKYDDSCDLLQDYSNFSNQSSEYPMRPWIPQAIDPPEQSAYRRVFNPWFTVEAMRPLEPHLEEFATELVDAMLESDHFDFVADFADPFPTKIFCELAGFPLEDYEQIMDWKNALMHANDGHSRGRQLAVDLAKEMGLEPGEYLTPDQELAVRGEVGQRVYAYLGELADKARANPGEGMVTKLVQASYEGERPLAQEELEDTLFLFFMAGLDTVASALGLIVQTFAQNPEKRHEFIDLMEDSERLDAAVEELVRYHSIVLLPRRVTADTSFHGVELSEGENIMCPTMAANRDPEEFDRPHELVYDRMPNRHIGFGLGPHRCIGIHLARRELRIALQVFHRKCPDYHLAPEGSVEAFGGMKGIAALPLVKG
jgi:cytochrome P450